MLKSSRDDDLTRSSKRNERTDDLLRISMKNKRTKSERCNEGETSDLHRASNQGFWSELNEEVKAKLSKNVVSLVLYDGQKMLSACSGIAVERVGCVTRFLTTAKLVKALNGTNEDHDDLKVEVRHEDNVFRGFLGEHDLDHNVAVVNVKNIPDLHAVLFKNMWKKLLPHSKVVSLGRDISGKLMVTSGTQIGDNSIGSEYDDHSSRSECDDDHSSRSESNEKLSTCKISEDYEGGPLFDDDGDFVGMNLSVCTEGTLFLPAIRVLERLTYCRSLREIEFPTHVGERLADETSISQKEIHRNGLSLDLYGDLESLSYPERQKSMSNDGMILVNNFEDHFGDMWGTGVWSELSETVTNNIKENTVALASFIGGERLVACTGFFIDWNGCTVVLTSASLLRKSGYENNIKVLLHNGQIVEGTLEHCSLHYNVALVSVKDSCVPQPAKVEHRWCDSCELLAVGCNFTSRRLMGTRGRQFPMVTAHDCKFLEYSTCRITTAGIGGPLVDFQGNFVGMNFYDEEVGGTPFLSWSEILDVLGYFKTKGTVAEVADPSRLLDRTIEGDCSVRPNRWPVPQPSDMDKHEFQSQTRRHRLILE